MTKDEWYAQLFERLGNSRFRSSFHLKQKDIDYINEKGLDTIREHARDFIAKREAPAVIPNDGKQTPMRGHPVFIAQHATATCCRDCIQKWHKLAAGRELSQIQQDYLVDVIMTWIEKELRGSERKVKHVAHADRKYKNLTAKQKLRIANKTYEAYRMYYLEHGSMPDDKAANEIHRKLFQMVVSLAPKTLFEEFEAICQKRVPKYEARIQTDIANGITLESLKEKRRKKTPEEKKAIQKKKNENRRKRREKKKAEAALERFNPDQDDEFFFIAGYTSGGAPYGVTWEEMGLNPWESLEDEQEEDVW